MVQRRFVRDGRASKSRGALEAEDELAAVRSISGRAAAAEAADSDSDGDGEGGEADRRGERARLAVEC